ncbi:aspartate carbamoyltransferase [Candidatus Roizmanbacteria bacterium RIFCSPLOWO2_01_FULL_38_12]|uniref:Aspartate carbamoyltransferase n=1 Tax=Candidatus Roizmanbacteria bacterium RIFCSPLOWO2_01_FULL_38_12 TaxID=1802061 RepID=A0A1F7IYU2_9BACT|nr:MAG: aspartate carbamoyltransferase [Candidatus Roizmanbacteria bacterium RIFCSPHIGHO2_01_FULL_38_15]OGK34409.1 MAG: aspartate carbamoyltransferase [Candidatus Roizmanbacteria bacterium RIFCSPHIGHO2_12_FULL_38_13]OGK48542.1 MAG: aspartate carbamoyltransferase [Candidatus Roizmanbacteria bacterium RIFCSPLOWO2_01_FULL_38_12]
MKKINGRFYKQNILSTEQFTKSDIDTVFKLAINYRKKVESGKAITDLKGKILTALFYEPSSRTFGSFIAAMQRLGGGVIPIQGITFSSVSKGETLEDTIRVFANYSDVIAMRHNETGAAQKAADVSPVPILNAGDGVGEHPTQGLLDLLTIKERLGRLDKIHIAMVGDLKYGRTVHSLTKLLLLFQNITFTFISPPLSPMPDEILKMVRKVGAKIQKKSAIVDIIKDIDVIYMTRIQKERMDPKIYKKMKNMFILDAKLANKMKKNSIILHPLPRIGEITTEVDKNPRSVYLTHQMRSGMFVRMALLKLILTK